MDSTDTVDPIVCMYSRLELTHEAREQALRFNGRPQQQNGVMGELPVQRLQRRTAMARPMPREAPVMNKVLRSRLMASTPRHCSGGGRVSALGERPSGGVAKEQKSGTSLPFKASKKLTLTAFSSFNPSLGNWNHTCIWQNVGSLSLQAEGWMTNLYIK